MATIGNSTITVTLSPTTPVVTLTGTIDAIADIGTYSIRIGDTFVPEPLSAAVFGPKTGHFTVINTGTVISPGNGLDFGILLAAGGTVLNSGQITAGNGIGILTGKGALVENTGTIDATFDTGIYLQSLGTVTNSKIIDAFSSGILLGAGGAATNASTGMIYSQTLNGIDAVAGATVQNAGTISGYETGLHFDAAGTVKNTGLISERDIGGTNSAYAAIFAGDGGTISNSASGTIYGGNGIVIGGAKAVITNAGTILASSTFDNTSYVTNGFLNFGVGIYAAHAIDIANTGTIAATHAGIVVENASGTVTNAGLINASIGYGVYLHGGGTVTNTGTINAYTQGIFVYNTVAAETGFISNAGLITSAAKPLAETISGNVYTFMSTALFQLGAGTLENLAHGTISASFGLGAELAALTINATSNVYIPLHGTLLNAGLIQADSGAQFYGIGGITNSGAILALQDGAEILDSRAFVFNSGVIEATGSVFSSGTITQAAAGILATEGGAVTNSAAGTIIATEGNGIFLQEGGFAKNAGHITGYRQGIVAAGTAIATIINTGAIIATGATFTNEQGIAAISHGILLKAGGYVTNGAAATITGETGIAILGTGAAYVYNYGHITATGHAGIYLYGAGYAFNAKSATIKAGGDGIKLLGGGEVYNYGVVNAGQTGMSATGGYIYNAGKITGAAGIALTGAGYAINAGTISAATAAIISNGAYLYNYAQITGGVSAAAGTYIYNTGTILSQPGNTVFIAGLIAGAGTIGLGAGLATLDGAVTGQNIAFTATAETLALGDAAAFAGTIQHFKAGDTIDLSAVPVSAITGENFAGGILTLSDSAGAIKLSFASPAAFKNETFALFTDAGGTGITLASTAFSPAAIPPPAAPRGWLAENLLTPSSAFLKSPLTLQS